jgi:uncharacterized protein YecT (DUF1311 family)
MKKWSYLIFAISFLCSCDTNSEKSSITSEEPQTNSEDIANNGNIKDETPFIHIQSKYDYEDDKSYSDPISNEINILDLEEEFTICIEDRENSGNTMKEVKCSEESYNKWDDALNNYYKKAMSLINDEDRTILKTAQISWSKFRDTEIDFLNALYQTFDETAYQTRIAANSKNILLIKNRTFDLVEWSFLNKRIPADIVFLIETETKSQGKESAGVTNCIEKSASSVETLGCLNTAAEQSDQLLNDNYKKLMQILSDELKSKLKTSQRAWLKFRNDELAAYYMDAKSMNGNLFKEERSIENINMMNHRALNFGEFITAINNMSQK